MLVISSREFRQNQRLYLDKADEGVQIIVQRGKDKSYVLTPIKEQDKFFSEEMIKHIKESLQQAVNGDYVEVATENGLKELLGL